MHNFLSLWSDFTWRQLFWQTAVIVSKHPTGVLAYLPSTALPPWNARVQSGYYIQLQILPLDLWVNAITIKYGFNRLFSSDTVTRQTSRNMEGDLQKHRQIEQRILKAGDAGKELSPGNQC